MPTTITLFVGSPDDVNDERNSVERVTRELNDLWGPVLDIRLELVRWESHAVPGFGADPQEVINQVIPDDYEVFIGIMWTRFGSPTNRAESGTEEEFVTAYSRWLRDSNSVRIMFDSLVTRPV